MPATLTLPASKKVRELLEEMPQTNYAFYQKGNYYCDSEFVEAREPELLPWQGRTGLNFPWKFVCEAPDFGETIRLLPLIAKKKGWLIQDTCFVYDGMTQKLPVVMEHLAYEYMLAPSPEEGMRLISEEIMKLV